MRSCPKDSSIVVECNLFWRQIASLDLDWKAGVVENCLTIFLMCVLKTLSSLLASLCSFHIDASIGAGSIQKGNLYR